MVAWSLDFSVAICTYNGEHRLPDLLSALLRQSTDLAWEVIVVDNNSQDETAAVVKTFWGQWPLTVPLSYAFEPQQGAGYARHTAIRLARAPLVGFLDDDNIPDGNWVQRAHDFAQVYPQAGAYGSHIQGLFETEPPAHFERIAAYLALTDRGPQPRPYAPSRKLLPPAAGLVVRRQAWLDHVPHQQVLSGRDGRRMLTGEDLEAVLYMQRGGWQVWYNPAMQVSHKIPTHRLQRPYLLSLFRGIGLSRHRTRMLSFSGWQRPLVWPLYLLNDLRKIVSHGWRYGWGGWCDTVAACELTLYCYSLLSPFYLGWLQGQRAIATRQKRH